MFVLTVVLRLSVYVVRIVPREARKKGATSTYQRFTRAYSDFSSLYASPAFSDSAAECYKVPLTL